MGVLGRLMKCCFEDKTVVIDIWIYISVTYDIYMWYIYQCGVYIDVPGDVGNTWEGQNCMIHKPMSSFSRRTAKTWKRHTSVDVWVITNTFIYILCGELDSVVIDMSRYREDRKWVVLAVGGEMIQKHTYSNIVYQLDVLTTFNFRVNVELVVAQCKWVGCICGRLLETSQGGEGFGLGGDGRASRTWLVVCSAWWVDGDQKGVGVGRGWFGWWVHRGRALHCMPFLRKGWIWKSVPWNNCSKIPMGWYKMNSVEYELTGIKHDTPYSCRTKPLCMFGYLY